MPDENQDSHFITDEAWAQLQRDMYGDGANVQQAPQGTFTDSESRLDPKEARKEAIILAQAESEIIQHLPKLERFKNVHVGDFYLHSTFGPGEITASYQKPITTGIGSGRFTLIHDTSRTWPSLKSLGINSNNRLIVFSHLDEATKAQAEIEVSKRGPHFQAHMPWTEYLFDEEGNMAKVAVFSAEYIDSRPDLRGADADDLFKMIELPMKAGDFELAGLAIQILQNEFVPTAEPHNIAK